MTKDDDVIGRVKAWLDSDQPGPVGLVRELLDRLTQAEGGVEKANSALKGIADDYMTSENHHPGYVLIPTQKFEQLVALASTSEPLTVPEGNSSREPAPSTCRGDECSLATENARLRKALEPFATWAADNVAAEEDGGYFWNGLGCQRERIHVWFGPSDFGRAAEAFALPTFSEPDDGAARVHDRSVHAEPISPLKHPETARHAAWLIERSDLGATRYYTTTPKGHGWAADPNVADKFPTEDAARAACQGGDKDGPLKVTEHIWLGLPQSEPLKHPETAVNGGAE